MDYAEFYDEWYGRALALARRRGIEDPESAAQDVMLVFFTTDYIERWDPTREGACSFETWVTGMMHRRLTSMYRRQARRQTMAPIQPLAETDDMAELAAAPYVERVRHLVPEGFSDAIRLLEDRYRSRPLLWRVLFQVGWQVAHGDTGPGGRAVQYRIAERLGVRRAEVGQAMRDLRELLVSDADLRDALGVHDRALTAA